jgi:hypothetical protein
MGMRVTWGAHNRALGGGNVRPNVDEGEGHVVFFLNDAQGHPAAVIVCDDGKFASIRLTELTAVDRDERHPYDSPDDVKRGEPEKAEDLRPRSKGKSDEKKDGDLNNALPN